MRFTDEKAFINQDLQYFIVMAECPTLLEAGERLRIGQSALSRAIQRLESAYGIPIFIRKKTGIHLTKEGRVLLQVVKQVHRESQMLFSKRIASDYRLLSQFSIGCHQVFAIEYGHRIINHFSRKEGSFSFQFKIASSRQTVENVRLLQVDFGIAVDPVPHPDLVVRPFLEAKPLVFGAGPAGKGMKGLKGQEALNICFNPEMVGIEKMLARLHSKGFSTVKHPVADYEVIASLVAMSGFLGILPDHVGIRLGLRPVTDAAFRIEADHFQACLIHSAEQSGSGIFKGVARRILSILKGA